MDIEKRISEISEGEGGKIFSYVLETVLPAVGLMHAIYEGEHGDELEAFGAGVLHAYAGMTAMIDRQEQVDAVHMAASMLESFRKDVGE